MAGATGGWGPRFPTEPRPALPPSAPPPPSPDRSRIIAGAAVGVVFAIIVAVVAALALRDNDGTGALPSDATATSRAPGGATTTPGGSAAPTTTTASSELEAAIDQAMAFVEKTRGKKYKSRPPVSVLADAAFVARYNQLLDKDYAEHKTDYDNATAIFQAFGVLPKGVSVVDAQREFGTAGVLGFYDPETNELTVRAGKVTPFAKTVLVHELTHALDDQYFELDRPQYDSAKDEIGFGFTAIAEGDARRVENAFRASMSAADQRSADREEAGYSANFSLGNLTVPFLQLQIAPYTYGEAFINNLLKNGGEAAVDAALVTPPNTSEQVMDFAKFQAHEARREVQPPSADGTVIEDGVVGQIGIQSILEGSVSRGTAAAAAAGWGGDWFVAWRDGGVPCVRVRAVMDTSRDLSELKSAFDSWARGRSGASVSATASDLTLTSCAR